GLPAAAEPALRRSDGPVPPPGAPAPAPPRDGPPGPPGLPRQGRAGRARAGPGGRRRLGPEPALLRPRRDRARRPRPVARAAAAGRDRGALGPVSGRTRRGGWRGGGLRGWGV